MSEVVKDQEEEMLARGLENEGLQNYLQCKCTKDGVIPVREMEIEYLGWNCETYQHMWLLRCNKCTQGTIGTASSILYMMWFNKKNWEDE